MGVSSHASAPGFIWQPKWSGTPFMVTALHVVAGANLITYEYTNSDKGKKKFVTQIAAVNRGDDLAFLSLSKDDSARPVLDVGESASDERDVYVFGYKGAQSSLVSSENAKIKLLGPSILSDIVKDPKLQNAMLSVGYPNIDLKVRAIDAIDPGNSGAPVFDIDGKVIGMAHGGVPHVTSWMIPASILTAATSDKVDPQSLHRLDLAETYAASGLFFNQEPSGIRLARQPGLFLSSISSRLEHRFGDYARRGLAENDERKWDDLPYGRRGGHLIAGESFALPGHFETPDLLDCSRHPDNVHCPDKRPQEQSIFDALNKSSVAVQCYSFKHFQDLLAGNSPSVADVDLQIPLGNIQGIVDDRYELEADLYRDHLWVRSNGFLDFRPGATGYKYRLNGVSTLDDLSAARARLSCGLEILRAQIVLRFGNCNRRFHLVPCAPICNSMVRWCRYSSPPSYPSTTI